MELFTLAGTPQRAVPTLGLSQRHNPANIINYSYVISVSPGFPISILPDFFIELTFLSSMVSLIAALIA